MSRAHGRTALLALCMIGSPAWGGPVVSGSGYTIRSTSPRLLPGQPLDRLEDHLTLAIRDSGRWLAVFEAEQPAGPVVMARSYEHDGSEVAGPFTVDGPGLTPSHPQAATRPGGFAMCWDRIDGVRSTVAMSLNDRGVSASAAVPLSSSTDDFADNTFCDLVWGSAGPAAVWLGGQSSTVRAQLRYRSPSTSGPRSIFGANGPVALDLLSAEDGVAMTWAIPRSASKEHWLGLFDLDGTPRGRPVIVSTGMNAPPERADVTASAGHVVVTWHEELSRPGAWFAIYDETLDEVVGPTELPGRTPSRVAVAAAGELVALTYADVSRDRVRFRLSIRALADGRPVVPELVVAVASANGIRDLSDVALAFDGTTYKGVVGWQADGGSGRRVFARTFEVVPSP